MGDSDFWQCPKCEWINKATEPHCKACHTQNTEAEAEIAVSGSTVPQSQPSAPPALAAPVANPGNQPYKVSGAASTNHAPATPIVVHSTTATASQTGNYQTPPNPHQRPDDFVSGFGSTSQPQSNNQQITVANQRPSQYGHHHQGYNAHQGHYGNHAPSYGHGGGAMNTGTMSGGLLGLLTGAMGGAGMGMGRGTSMGMGRGHVMGGHPGGMMGMNQMQPYGSHTHSNGTTIFRIHESMFGLGDNFTIQDQSGRSIFRVRGKFLSFGDNLTVEDMRGRRVARIVQEMFSYAPRYRIGMDGRMLEVRKEFSFMKQCFRLMGPNVGYSIEGTFLGNRNFSFIRGGRRVATVSKALLSFSDSYGVKIVAGEDTVAILCACIVIDQVLHDGKARPNGGMSMGGGIPLGLAMGGFGGLRR